MHVSLAITRVKYALALCHRHQRGLRFFALDPICPRLAIKSHYTHARGEVSTKVSAPLRVADGNLKLFLMDAGGFDHYRTRNCDRILGMS